MPSYGANESSSQLPLSQIEDMQRKGMDNNQIIQALQRDGYNTSQIFDALNQTNLQPTQPGPAGFPPQGQTYSGGYDTPTDSNEEMIEAIINEKWNDLVKDINRIVQWKESVGNQLSRLEQRMEGLKGEFDKLHEAVLGKVGEYDRNILEVGAEVKAMEKVFSKVLPVFTENVAELSRISESMRKPRK